MHCAYIIYTVAGMGLLCLWRPGFFLATEEGRAVAGFMGVFWSVRVVLQLFYYDRAMTRSHPFWHARFAAAFGALGVLFLYLLIRP